MKFDPWSLQIDEGFPLRAMKRLRQAINASVDRSETSSRWTPLMDIDTKTHTYDFKMVGLCTTNRTLFEVQGTSIINADIFKHYIWCDTLEWKLSH